MICIWKGFVRQLPEGVSKEYDKSLERWIKNRLQTGAGHDKKLRNGKGSTGDTGMSRETGGELLHRDSGQSATSQDVASFPVQTTENNQPQQEAS